MSALECLGCTSVATEVHMMSMTWCPMVTAGTTSVCTSLLRPLRTAPVGLGRQRALRGVAGRAARHGRWMPTWLQSRLQLFWHSHLLQIGPFCNRCGAKRLQLNSVQQLLQLKSTSLLAIGCKMMVAIHLQRLGICNCCKSLPEGCAYFRYLSSVLDGDRGAGKNARLTFLTLLKSEDLILYLFIWSERW